jgi:hypothetical protein
LIQFLDATIPKSNSKMNCKCNTRMDIRARCMPKHETFTYCSARVDTVLWMIQNDYDAYREIENADDRYEALKTIAMRNPYKLTHNYAMQVVSIQKTEDEVSI